MGWTNFIFQIKSTCRSPKTRFNTLCPRLLSRVKRTVLGESLITTRRLCAISLDTIISLFLISCASEQVLQADSAKKMDFEEARKRVQALSVPQHFEEYTWPWTIDNGSGPRPIAKVHLTATSVTFTTQEGDTIKMSLANVNVTRNDDSFTNVGNVRVDDLGKSVAFVITNQNWCCGNLADAIYVLGQEAHRRSVEDADRSSRFQEALTTYGPTIVKPPMPEEARKFKVQAEAAIADKQFDEAADLYGKALDVAPWWPEGHFNRALILGETGDLDQAIVEMKRYLALVPNATNTRAAQDKIYVWERQAQN